MIPADLQLPDRYEHGTRARYVTGCRCLKCRRANAAYAAQRAKAPPNPFVSADTVREHLANLTAAGIGLRVVAEMAGCARSTLGEIRRGVHAVIRLQLACRILAVGIEHAAEGAIVDGAETHALIGELLRAGYRKGQIARMLGYERAALQLRKDRVLAKTADAIRSLHAELMAEAEGDGERRSMRERMLDAIARYDGITCEALADAMGIERDERDAFTQTVHRAWKAGYLERSGGKPYVYRRVAKAAANLLEGV